MAIPGIAPEARVRLRYDTRRVRFADGHEVELRSPILQLSELGYGPLHPDTLFSLRTAPQMIGLGLLEAIPEQALLANADPEDRDGDGISGRPNRVYDQVSGDTVIGRFGWKAGQPTLNQQNADAFFNDMGLSTSLFSGSSCTDAQSACADMPHGGEPEVSDSILAQVLFYTRNLGVPMRRDVDHPRSWPASACSIAPVARIAIRRSSPPPAAVSSRSWQGRSFAPIPTCCCMTWAMGSPMAPGVRGHRPRVAHPTALGRRPDPGGQRAYPLSP